jgi:hypothetical protein
MISSQGIALAPRRGQQPWILGQVLKKVKLIKQFYFYEATFFYKQPFFSAKEDKKFEKAYVMCFNTGASFGFQCVSTMDFPTGMELKDVTHRQRMQEFQHAFFKDAKVVRRYMLFAICEKGKQVYRVFSLVVTCQ